MIYAVLKALGLVDPTTLDRLEPLQRPAITNHRDQVVGEIRPVFALTRFDPTQPLPEAR